MVMEIDREVLVDEMEQVAHEVSREVADVAFAASQDTLAEADSQEPDSDYFPILQSGTPPKWDESRQAWVYSYSHVAAVFAEWGTEPHEIRAKEAEFLAFEWPDAPAEIREQFRSTFPLVFFKKVNHPGTPAIGYVRAGLDEATQALRQGVIA